MQYIISPATFYRCNINYETPVADENGKHLFCTYAGTKEESRLRAIKLAMLLAIQESEKMMSGKIA